MKVFSLPAAVQYAEPDHRNYDSAVEDARENDHKKAVEAWLRANGYNGKRTGEILRIPHADGYALYMFAEGSKCALINLPYCDAWNSPHAARMTKADVVRSLDGNKALERLFGSR